MKKVDQGARDWRMGAALVAATSSIAQRPTRRRGSRRSLTSQRSDEQRAIAAEFASHPACSTRSPPTCTIPALAQALLVHERYVSTASTLPPRHRLLLGASHQLGSRDRTISGRTAPRPRGAPDSLTRSSRASPSGRNVAGWDPFEATLLRAADELHVDSFISDSTWRAALGDATTRNQMIDTRRHRRRV